MFWLAVTLFIDPGGYIQTYLPREMLGGLQITDLTFLLLFIPLISPKIKLLHYFRLRDNKWIIVFLSSYTIIYHIFIFGYVTPGGKISDLLDLLQYQRLTITGFIAIIPAYIFFQRNYQLLFKFALVTSAFLILFYIIKLTTGLNIIPVWVAERIQGSGIMRIALLSYGYAHWFIYISLICLLYRISLPNRKLIFFIGIVIFVAIILTLTRRSLIQILFSFLIIYVIHQKMLGLPLLSLHFYKIIVSLGVLLLVLFLVIPKYLNYSILGMQDIVSLIQIGETIQGQKDMRMVSDIPQHIARFKQAPVLGYGWDPLWYSNFTEKGGLSANDIPLTAALGMFGILGLLLFTPFYFRVFKILYQSYKILCVSYLNNIAQNNGVLFSVCLLLLVIFVVRYTLGFMGYFGDLVHGAPRVHTMLYLGFLLSARDKFRVLVYYANKPLNKIPLKKA